MTAINQRLFSLYCQALEDNEPYVQLFQRKARLSPRWTNKGSLMNIELNKAKKVVNAVYAWRPNLKATKFVRALNNLIDAVERGELSLDDFFKRLVAFMRNLGLRD